MKLSVKIVLLGEAVYQMCSWNIGKSFKVLIQKLQPMTLSKQGHSPVFPIEYFQFLWTEIFFMFLSLGWSCYQTRFYLVFVLSGMGGIYIYLYIRYFWIYNCVKCVRIQSLSCLCFLAFGLNVETYSVYSEYGHFSRFATRRLLSK